jgi:two-component system LytT family response regulator
MPLRVLIVDDEALGRERIRRLLRKEADIDVVAEAADGVTAVERIQEMAPDLVFLDIQMPDMDGFGVLEKLGARDTPAIIFVTAYDQHAVKAFEVHAIDYLLKPFNAQRFRSAFRRARALLSSSNDSHGERLASLIEQLRAERRELEQLVLQRDTRYVERLLIRNEGKVFFVKTAEIDWVEAAGNYVHLHLGPTRHLLRETISGLAARLDPALFARIHRSTIVNLDRVKEMRPWFAGDYIIVLESGEELKLSRNYRDALMAAASRSAPSEAAEGDEDAVNS